MEQEALEFHLLDWSNSLEYVKDNLEDLNELSIAVCKYTPFAEGYFYTFLPKNVTKEKLHGFTWGGIQQGLRKKVEAKAFLIIDRNSFVAIFDSFEEEYDPNDTDLLFSQLGVRFDSEVYYVIPNKEITEKIFTKCFKKSHIIWHALCVVSDVNFSRREDKLITQSEIINFAKKARMIILGAYDGEGYIFWEKTEK